MTRVTARERYDEMIRLQIAPGLKELEFRRARSVFRRPHEGGWHFIDFQASQFGSGDAVKFTINVGVAYEPLRAPEETWSPAKPPPGNYPHAQERIGWLLPKQEDVWWKLDDSTDMDRLTDEVTEVVHQRAVVWVEANKTIEASLAAAAGPNALRSFHWSRLDMLARKAGRADIADRLPSGS